MTDEEKVALKAACLQYVTALNDAAHPRVPIDAEECAKLAKELYRRVTGQLTRRVISPGCPSAGRREKSFFG
jgi:hypothetical protein